MTSSGVNIWIGVEFLSSVFFAIERWFEQLFNGIMENGLTSFLVVMAALVILFWIFRAVGGAFTGRGTDAVMNYKDSQKPVIRSYTINKSTGEVIKSDTWRHV